MMLIILKILKTLVFNASIDALSASIASTSKQTKLKQCIFLMNEFSGKKELILG
jgi:hypothetical protein